jgi:hypothetical protein
VTVSDDVTIASGETTTLTSSAPGGVTYSWSPTTGLSDPGSATTDASPTVTTTYTVTVTDADGCENFESVTVTVDGVLGGTDLENTAIKLHPNPTTGVIFVTNSGTDEPFRLEIYTTEGKQVYTSEGLNLNVNEPIDLSYLARGVYFVKISTRENQFQEKVVLH